jgi:hypothetical protein
MGVLVSIVDRFAVDGEIRGHHGLGGTAGDGVPVHFGPVQRQRRRYLLRHRFDIVWCDESPAP